MNFRSLARRAASARLMTPRESRTTEYSVAEASNVASLAEYWRIMK